MYIIIIVIIMCIIIVIHILSCINISCISALVLTSLAPSSDEPIGITSATSLLVTSSIICAAWNACMLRCLCIYIYI